MTDISTNSDFTQASTLRTVAPAEVSRPSGTVSERPVEENASSGNSEDTNQSGVNSNASGEEDGREPLDRAASRVEELLAETELPKNTQLRIELDEENGRFIYQSVDKETGEVVSQFPPEEIIDLLRSFRPLEGIAIDNTA